MIRRICVIALVFSFGGLTAHQLRSEGLQQEAEIRAAVHEFCPKFWANWDKVRDNPEVQKYCPEA